MLMIDAPGVASKAGSSRRVKRNAAVKLTANTASRAESSHSAYGRTVLMPALLTNVSHRPPTAVSRLSATASVAPRSARSTRCGTNRPPSSASIAAASTMSRRASAFRSKPWTYAPWRRNRNAMARPIPPPAPATTTRRTRLMRFMWTSGMAPPPSALRRALAALVEYVAQEIQQHLCREKGGAAAGVIVGRYLAQIHADDFAPFGEPLQDFHDVVVEEAAVARRSGSRRNGGIETIDVDRHVVARTRGNRCQHSFGTHRPHLPHG